MPRALSWPLTGTGATWRQDWRSGAVLAGFCPAVLLARLASTGLGDGKVAAAIGSLLVWACWQFLVAGTFAVILSGAFSPELAPHSFVLAAMGGR